jgi:FMN-dependent NADH-azoreductase
MSQNNILHVTASGRHTGSVTRAVADQVIEQLLAQHKPTSVVSRDLAHGLPFVDESWITANFTDPLARTDDHVATLALSDELVAELQQAEHIVIATPIYNFGVPAALKAWIDMVARVKLTFQYTATGPQGLLSNKQVYLVIASGGTPIGSGLDFASGYLRHVLGFLGMQDVIIVDALAVQRDGSLDLADLQQTAANS